MNVVFFETASGTRPVEKYIDGLERREAERVVACLLDIERNGLGQASGVSFRQIEGKLWEIRPLQHRIFYVMKEKDSMVLLHAYKKESRKAPPNEIRIAEKRMREALERRGT